MESTRKKQKELTLSEKIQVLELLQRQKISQMELAKRFGVTQPVISRLIKNKEKVLMEWHNNSNPDRKRKREGRDSDVDTALLQWFQVARAQHILVSDEALAAKAKGLADAMQIRNFVPTVGWINRWKARHGPFLQQAYGEADGRSPLSGSASQDVVPPEGMTEEEFHQYVEQAAIKVCVWDIADQEPGNAMKEITKSETIDVEEEKTIPTFKMARGTNGQLTPSLSQYNMPYGRSSASRRDICMEVPSSSYSQPGTSGYQSYAFPRWIVPEAGRKRSEGKSLSTVPPQLSNSFEGLDKAETHQITNISLSPTCARIPSTSSPRPLTRDDLLFLQQHQAGIPRYGTRNETEVPAGSSEEQELILENQRKFGLYLDEKRESLKRLHVLEEELLRAKIEVEQLKAARLRELSVLKDP
ncbi:fibrinogen silencer-binding protein-like [Stegostoma tigrinum]|uniref:fibrinogen silencer-binding protein-like n=1 Tax=Stegostoma tigrinum TaxID=3053191 RepID=UPI00202B4D32|nr:fibrinogen silencer-binding protein-like [Stegostoma tigrinum]